MTDEPRLDAVCVPSAEENLRAYSVTPLAARGMAEIIIAPPARSYSADTFEKLTDELEKLLLTARARAPRRELHD